MSYFVTKKELLEEIEKAVDAVFSAVARMFSDEDERIKRKLKALENNFLLLINTVGRSGSHQYEKNNKKRRKKMEEEKAIRPFEEVLEQVVEYVLSSEDHELIILIDELEKSAKDETEKKEKIKGKLREIFKKSRAFLKDVEEGKKEES